MENALRGARERAFSTAGLHVALPRGDGNLNSGESGLKQILLSSCCVIRKTSRAVTSPPTVFIRLPPCPFRFFHVAFSCLGSTVAFPGLFTHGNKIQRIIRMMSPSDVSDTRPFSSDFERMPLAEQTGLWVARLRMIPRPGSNTCLDRRIHFFFPLGISTDSV